MKLYHFTAAILLLSASITVDAPPVTATSVQSEYKEAELSGDINADGSFSAEDVALLKEWLLGNPDVQLMDWKAADLCGDNVLDAFDLCLMKKKLASSPAEYRLVWSDEFNGDTIDSTKWGFELGNWKLDASGNYITNGWGNNEQQFYTDSNASVKDGVLTISARKEHYSDSVQGEYEYTSAKLSSQYLFSTCGGRIEVRARCDSGKSLWPAIWMLPEDSAYGGWAASGEIDIMEGWGSKPEKICGTIHFGDIWPNNTYLTNEYEFSGGDSTAEWHTYAIEWERDEIRWYVDDTLYSTQTDWYSANRTYPAPFDQNFYLILNLAVGGHFDGVDGYKADPSIFENGENAGTLEYAVIGLVRGKQVQTGTVYTLSFDVSSTTERDMVVTAEDKVYARYIDEKIRITPETTHYSFDVTFPDDMTGNLADLKFQLGNISDAASLGEHTVTISNISWTAD